MGGVHRTHSFARQLWLKFAAASTEIRPRACISTPDIEPEKGGRISVQIYQNHATSPALYTHRGRTRRSHSSPELVWPRGCLDVERDSEKARPHTPQPVPGYRGASISRSTAKGVCGTSSHTPGFHNDRLLKRGEDRFALLLAKVHEGNDEGSNAEEHDKEHDQADGPCGKAII